MNSYWLPNVIPLIFPITVIPTNPYYIPYQLPITMPTNLIPIIIPFLVLLYSPTSQTTHTQRTPPPRPHWSRPPRRQTRPPTWRTTLGAAWDRVHNGQAKQKKNKQKWGVNHEKTCDFTMKNGIQPKKNVYEPTDMMILPTGLWISHIQKPDQRGIQPDKGRIEPGKMGSSPK